MKNILLFTLMLSLSGCLFKKKEVAAVTPADSSADTPATPVGPSCNSQLSNHQYDSRDALCGDLSGMVFQEITPSSNISLKKIGFRVFNDGVTNPPGLFLTAYASDYTTILGTSQILGTSIPAGTYWGAETDYTYFEFTNPIQMTAGSMYVFLIEVPLDTCGPNDDAMIIFRNSFNNPAAVGMHGVCGQGGCGIGNFDLNYDLQTCH
jgi:hypothetical protein